ncbi:MAG TPA: VOC family protein [Caproiciproducens sp.]|nr:VOC family protein [Caproiciproducens sp.]
MKFSGPLISAVDFSVSRKFYEEVFGLKVICDFGANITFEGGFSLQTKETWAEFIDKSQEEILTKSNNFELYFEEEDFDGFLEHLKKFPEIELVHGVKTFPWGQRGIRFYDPDKHILEVGETMTAVIKRFLKQGLSVEETSKITMMPMEYVKSCL